MALPEISHGLDFAKKRLLRSSSYGFVSDPALLDSLGLDSDSDTIQNSPA